MTAAPGDLSLAAARHDSRPPSAGRPGERSRLSPSARPFDHHPRDQPHHWL